VTRAARERALRALVTIEPVMNTGGKPRRRCPEVIVDLDLEIAEQCPAPTAKGRKRCRRHISEREKAEDQKIAKKIAWLERKLADAQARQKRILDQQRDAG